MTFTALHPYLLPAGFLAGILVLMLFFFFQRKKTSGRILHDVLKEIESQRGRETEAIIHRMKDAFGHVALEVLTTNNEAFLQLARERLQQHTQAATGEIENKRQQIEHSLGTMRSDLKKVEEMVLRLEKDREKKYGELAEQLRSTAEQTGQLQETTYQLREALTNSRARGQWGERMAEDILRLSGFQEGINYQKQGTIDGGRQRPDFTFFLPRDRLIHMDVKFPFDNYLRYLETENEREKAKQKDRFLKDVRARIREITTRDYINPAKNTLNYVLLFIPNEQVFSFIHEQDKALIDHALKNQVILCSPLTLYAMLAIIRQAVENFNLEKTTSQVLSHMGTFQKQWEGFIISMDKMGKRIEDAQKEFDHLLSTRKNQVEKPLQEIEKIRREQRIQVNIEAGNTPPAGEEDEAATTIQPETPEPPFSSQ